MTVKLKALISLYRWHPCGDGRVGGNGLLLTTYQERDIPEHAKFLGDIGSRYQTGIGGFAPDHTRMTYDGLSKFAVVKVCVNPAQTNLYVTEHVMEALVIWNRRGFGNMTRAEFLFSVVAPSWELDEADACERARKAGRHARVD